MPLSLNDNMSAGYNFEQYKIKARLSFTVQNVFTITKYKGLDPEVDEVLIILSIPVRESLYLA